jgi:hypothetical protein
MLCPRAEYPMCSFISKSDSIVFTPRFVNTRLYIYSSQLNVIGNYRHANQNLLIHGLKTRHMLCTTVKNPMCSFKLNYNSILIIQRLVKSRLYTYFTTNFNRNESKREKNPVIHDLKTGYMSCPQVKNPVCSSSY